MGSAAPFPLEDPPRRGEPGAASAPDPPFGKAVSAPPLPAGAGAGSRAGCVFGAGRFLLSGGGGLARRRERASLRAELRWARRLPALTPSSPPLPDLARRSHPVYIKPSFSSREIKERRGYLLYHDLCAVFASRGRSGAVKAGLCFGRSGHLPARCSLECLPQSQTRCQPRPC